LLIYATIIEGVVYMSGVRGRASDEYVVTSVRVEKWKLEAAKRAGINISEVVRRALDIALAAKSRSVSSRDVLHNAELAEVVCEEFQREIEEAEIEEEERRKRAAEVAAKIEAERDAKHRREGKRQAERLKAWLRKRPAVAASIIEYLREGISEEEIYAWLMYEMRAPFVFVRVFKEVLRWLLEEHARGLQDRRNGPKPDSGPKSCSEPSEESPEELIKQARSILEGY